MSRTAKVTICFSDKISISFPILLGFALSIEFSFTLEKKKVMTGERDGNTYFSLAFLNAAYKFINTKSFPLQLVFLVAVEPSLVVLHIALFVLVAVAG